MQRSLSPHDDSARDIARRIRGGDKLAFGVFFNEHYKQLYLLCLKYLKDDALAQDAVQDVFCKIWIGRSSINPDRPLRNFLFSIAKNYLLNTLRDNKSAERRILEYVATNYQAAQEETSRNDRAVQSLLSALDRLPKKRRIIAKLKLYKDFSNDEIARKLKISINTVKVHYRLAMQEIRKLYRQR